MRFSYKPGPAASARDKASVSLRSCAGVHLAYLATLIRPQHHLSYAQPRVWPWRL